MPGGARPGAGTQAPRIYPPCKEHAAAGSARTVANALRSWLPGGGGSGWGATRASGRAARGHAGRGRTGAVALHGNDGQVAAKVARVQPTNGQAVAVSAAARQGPSLTTAGLATVGRPNCRTAWQPPARVLLLP